MDARPRKVEIVVLGRGLAAAALAEALVGRGRRVALLVESPGWEQGVRPVWQGDHAGEAASLAAEGAACLEAWQAAGLPGVLAGKGGAGAPLWQLDYDLLLPALGERVAAGERSWGAIGTRVRGVSVIENAILGAIAEDARYDARLVVNAAEDDRYSAFARMMRHPQALDLRPAALLPDGPPVDHAPPLAEQGPVRGAWRLRGVAGQPLLAVGLAARLAARLGEG